MLKCGDLVIIRRPKDYDCRNREDIFIHWFEILNMEECVVEVKSVLTDVFLGKLLNKGDIENYNGDKDHIPTQYVLNKYIVKKFN